MNGTKAVMNAYGISNPRIAAVISSQNLRKLNIKQALRPYLERSDIGLDTALRPIGLALKAKIVLNDQELDDLDTQLKASEMALKLLLGSDYRPKTVG